MNRPQKITFGEMGEMGLRGLLVYCSGADGAWREKLVKGQAIRRTNRRITER